jgi:hypothetical protein
MSWIWKSFSCPRGRRNQLRQIFTRNTRAEKAATSVVAMIVAVLERAVKALRANVAPEIVLAARIAASGVRLVQLKAAANVGTVLGATDGVLTAGEAVTSATNGSDANRPRHCRKLASLCFLTIKASNRWPVR